MNASKRSKRSGFGLAVLLLIGLLIQFSAHAASPIPEGFLCIPSQLTFQSGKSGSGFCFRTTNFVYLATARHVLIDPLTGALLGKDVDVHCRTGGKGESIPYTFTLHLEQLAMEGNIKPHTNHDIVVVKFGIADTNGWSSATRHVTYKDERTTSFPICPVDLLSLQSEVEAGTDVFVAGYPTSIGVKPMPQIDYSVPLFRKGIVAAQNFKKRTIIIDAAVYFGNSGGPVIQRDDVFNNRYRVIGIVSEMIPFVDVMESQMFRTQNANISNSGYAVVEPVDFILELL